MFRGRTIIGNALNNTLDNVREVSDVVRGANKIKGKVVLVKANLLGFTKLVSSSIDHVSEFVGEGVTVQLVSAVHGENANGYKGKVGKPSKLRKWNGLLTGLLAEDSAYDVNFDWDDNIGIPGAVIVRNNHESEFFLKTITLTFDDFPGVEPKEIIFVCNSWVYPKEKYNYERLFFANKSYLPSETPGPLRYYREQEKVNLRGDGTKELKDWDRVYDYALYNDLGDPDKGDEFARAILGGSPTLPYPRRGRTSRPPTRTDPRAESGMPILQDLSVYVPRDERFGHAKLSDFLAFAIKTLSHGIKPALKELFDGTEEIDSFEELYKMYDGGLKLPSSVLNIVKDLMPGEALKELFRTDGESFLRFPTPQIISHSREAWRTDDEFARETLAGANPIAIRRLDHFPPRSNLDPEVYGNQNSTITEAHILKNLEGMSVSEALSANKLYIVDYHDVCMPYLRRVNTMTDTRAYVTRTLYYLRDDDTLKILAIELSLPHESGDQYGAVSRVLTPATHGVEGTFWTLAKAYVAVNDVCSHQLLSHWLRTHAVVEPFILAVNRQLSVMHPIHNLLRPHFRDTMFINASARQSLINADGLLEKTNFTQKFSLEFSATVYKDWKFTEQSHPADLLKRGMAVKDPSAPHGLRLLIKDYPYAADGLEIWSAIHTWVNDYCNSYYHSDAAVQGDTELQAFWKELREVGHGDLKDAAWWPKMHTREELIDSCATLIWITSALHAAVNFGQYPYGGFLPNRPTMSRRLLPEPGTPEYNELERNPDKAYFKTITTEKEGILGVGLLEILSKHASDEVYLGQRDTEKWTADAGPLRAFKRFGAELARAERVMMERNADPRLKNRLGPVRLAYTLLAPSSEEGLTARGIPNSISI